MSDNNNVNTRKRPPKKKSQMADVWRRFKRNITAMVGLFIIIILVLTAIFANVIAPPVFDDRLGDYMPSYMQQNLRNANAFPSGDNWFGTDNFGRDIFSRVVHGSRISLQVGFVVVSVSAIFGVILGAISGFYGGIADNVLMRIIDIMLAIPNILLAVAIAAALGAGLINVMIAVGIGAIPGFARIVRGSVLTLREQEFIEAARSIGANDYRLIGRHILPNCMAPIIIQATMGLAGAILSAAALAFIGLGVQPPAPEWGAMLNDGRRFMREFWPIVMFPGGAIAMVVLGFNMLGDGLRDALDPRLKK